MDVTLVANVSQYDMQRLLQYNCDEMDEETKQRLTKLVNDPHSLTQAGSEKMLIMPLEDIRRVLNCDQSCPEEAASSHARTLEDVVNSVRVKV